MSVNIGTGGSNQMATKEDTSEETTTADDAAAAAAVQSAAPGSTPTCTPGSGKAAAPKSASEPSSTKTPGGTPNTPGRKNKRKMTEPKKRLSDFSIKRFCPDSPQPATCISDSIDSIDVECATSLDRGSDTRQESPPPTPSPPRRDHKQQQQQQQQYHSFLSNSPGVFMAGSGGVLPFPAHYYPLNVPMVYNSRMIAAPLDAARSVSGGSAIGIPYIPVIPSSRGVPHPSSSASQDAGPSRSASATPTPSPSASVCSSAAMDNSFITPSPPERMLAGDGCDLEGGGGRGGGRRARKNYKNMTRERRVEANARERTRVHTISAAFDSLRHAVPSYSYNQRLSKLAILRIACSYILALSRLADLDYSEEQSSQSFAQCVDLCTKTIQTEGRAKRRH